MFTNLFLTCTIISAIALLWRVFSKETIIEKAIDGLPHLIKKPLTCGVCFTFWLSFFCNLIFNPVLWNISANSLINFLAHWMITGMVSVSIYYIFLTFYEGSHYLAHKAEKLHVED